MKRLLNLLYTGILFFGTGMLFSCQETDVPAGEQPMKTVKIQLSVGNEYNRAFSNNDPHNVNRILIIPCKKADESLSNDNANFSVDIMQSIQKDVTGFPVTDIELVLQEGTTYKLMVVGFNRNDYDFENALMGGAGNNFQFQSTTGSMNGLTIQVLRPQSVPEVFSCVCSTSQGEAFLPEDNSNITGTLIRLVSGLSLSINNIPEYVDSISLSAYRLAQSAYIWNRSWGGSIYNEGGNIMEMKAPTENGDVTFNHFLLPNAGDIFFPGTNLLLGFKMGTSVEHHLIEVADSPVSIDNSFFFYPNQAINLSGDYSNMNIGFNIEYEGGINLDDDTWDGIQ